MQKEDVRKIVDDILADYEQGRVIDSLELMNVPNKTAIVELMDKVIAIMYYGYDRDRSYKVYDVRTSLATAVEDAIYRMRKQIALVLPYAAKYCNCEFNALENEAERLALEFFRRVPKIRSYLEHDLNALLEGDPAASCKEEIIFSYPGFYAITVYRIAHELFELKVPMIPRILSEQAHGKTGIDIHPGATIGKSFFIDHGTGIVIGETTIIGEHVKIYQGVTLGALSTSGGQSLKGVKRHPTIEDNVTIYANASVLGDIVIGEGTVVGGNVFITASVPAGTKVRANSQDTYKFREAQ